MRLARAGGPAQQHILFLADVVARSQLQDLLAIEVGVKAKIEAFQGLGAVDGGAPQAQLQLLLGATLDLVFE